MDPELFEHHLSSAHGRGREPVGGAVGVAGTRLCGDVVRITLALDASGARVGQVGWDADACGATIASLSAVAELVSGMAVLDVARIGAHDVADALGGLSAGKFHAAELVADALARALGLAVRERGAVPAPGPTVARDGDRAAAGASDGAAPPAGGRDDDAAQDGAAGARTRTLVAMSGGVDSAVVALLAGRDGGDAVAVTLELWADEANDGERSCCSAQAVRFARALAHRMGMPHLTLDLRDEFRAGVVTPFLEDHRAGLTPNPCVRCNGDVRLDAMLDFADRLGAETLATGHYARVEWEGGDPLLRVARDAWKDQTYMLAALAPASLARLCFPLGELTKPEVRALAAEAELPVASKPESQDLCFMAGTSRSAFLARHAGIEEQTGEIVDSGGRVLGRHRGHHAFTVGQRRGLGVAAEEPLYVLRTEPARNRVVAGPREELQTTSVALRGARLHRDGARVDRVKLRYRAKPLAARLVGEPAAGSHRRLEVALQQPVDGAAPGQLACLMDGDVVIGWATIDRPRAERDTAVAAAERSATAAAGEPAAV
ncbi:tRNA 2-thiouridine(34) synthase MnmA [Conexibacter sp. CPCC 206217]|uniref:tRNA 2-thiouridine(34) synthase MnmA n=1 Tax=Conexibacter sp. CPCC 206217 TaxID=3064574 RepID=UPI002723D76C|nr:tRNA 2-thiouridine(34) synthase MnmA [Conexibacter sp. CPCC 206217]MDO8210844.1 tRNA 2-thiouridine(34) synthase MnmA [Conexibacter sp. CPCC 206217]